MSLFDPALSAYFYFPFMILCLGLLLNSCGIPAIQDGQFESSVRDVASEGETDPVGNGCAFKLVGEFVE